MGVSIAVFGAGSWGTALAVNLSASGHTVTLWARRKAVASAMARDRHNPSYLPDIHLSESIHITSDLAQAAYAAPFWIIATPSHGVRAIAQSLQPYVTTQHIVVSVAKGIENDTLLTTTQVLQTILTPPVSQMQLGVLYGPSHAEEVGAGKPATVVAAAYDSAIATSIQAVFMSRNLRVYVNDDVLGVEIGGSVKNVMAIATGISDGIGYGDNAKAALITRGMAEIQRLGVAMGARPATFAGLTGIGDLVVTCTSRLSRNRYFGEQIGKGKSPEDVQEEMQMIAEGVRTTASTRALALRYGIEMPITEAVHGILFKGQRPIDAVHDLMARAAKRED